MSPRQPEQTGLLLYYSTPSRSTPSRQSVKQYEWQIRRVCVLQRWKCAEVLTNSPHDALKIKYENPYENIQYTTPNETYSIQLLLLTNHFPTGPKKFTKILVVCWVEWTHGSPCFNRQLAAAGQDAMQRNKAFDIPWPIPCPPCLRKDRMFYVI